MFVLTVDQRASRRGPDRVDDVLAVLNAPDPRAGRRPVRAFERTAGDEVQGLLDDAGLVLDLALALVRDGHWSIGIGAGPVRTPLPRSTRAGAGPAYEHARSAVERAKGVPEHVAVAGPDAGRAAEVDALVALLAAVVQRRSDQGWEACDLVASGLSGTGAAERLGISKQALSQRLHTGLWPQEARVRPVATRLLAELDAAGPPGTPT